MASVLIQPPNTFEWWYIEGIFDDGSNAQFTFFTKPWMESSLPFDPYLVITITTPNGTTFNNVVSVSKDQFSAARGEANVTMGKNWLRGNLSTYELHVESRNGYGANLIFTRAAPSTRIGETGINYFDPFLTQKGGWFIALPYAKVQGTLTYNGQTHQVQGNGYHDHNWGTFDYNKVLDRWYWTRAHIGNYTLDLAMRVASSFYNYQQSPAFYLAKGKSPNRRHQTPYCARIG